MNSESPYEVIIIKEGYAKWAGPSKLHADGSITLVKGPKNLIVDTGLPQDKDIIIACLLDNGLKPQNVDYVVCTHGHSDHIGNNNLFADATFIVSYDVSRGDLYIVHDFNSYNYKIDDYIEITATPGHTAQDVTVIVKTNSGIVAITGDLFENEEDLKEEWFWRACSVNQSIQDAHRKRIIEIADFIVPGHGPKFKVLKD